MPHMTGARAAIATLQAHGVDTIFGIPGVHTLSLYDAMRKAEGLRHVLARHEQGAGFMADGYARVSGKVGVACTITGPGLTNIATPVAQAYADSIPLLVISAALPRASKGRMLGELHEVKNQAGVMEALAGWTRVVEQVEEIPFAIRDAFRAMGEGRPRGAYIEIPYDLLEMEAELNIPKAARIAMPAPTPEQIEELARLLSKARRPLIIAGHGVTAAGANEQVRRLAELLNAPALLGAKSRDALPNDHSLVLATSGYAIPHELRELVAASDVALVIGSKLGAERTGHGRLRPPAVIAQIDIDAAEIGRHYPVTLGIAADARVTLDALLDALQGHITGNEVRSEELARTRESLERHARRIFGQNLSYLDAVRTAVPRDGVIVADMTMLGYASSEYMPVYEPRTYIHPNELCTIGCGLPMALGAKVAAPNKPVIALCGDGGFLLNVGELAVAAQEEIAVVTVLFNDATYTAVKAEQRASYEQRYFATDLRAPDYVALARAFGVRGVRAETPEQLQLALADAIVQAGSTLIEAPLPPKQW